MEDIGPTPQRVKYPGYIERRANESVVEPLPSSWPATFTPSPSCGLRTPIATAPWRKRAWSRVGRPSNSPESRPLNPEPVTPPIAPAWEYERVPSSGTVRSPDYERVEVSVEASDFVHAQAPHELQERAVCKAESPIDEAEEPLPGTKEHFRGGVHEAGEPSQWTRSEDEASHSECRIGPSCPPEGCRHRLVEDVVGRGDFTQAPSAAASMSPIAARWFVSRGFSKVTKTPVSRKILTHRLRRGFRRSRHPGFPCPSR